MKIISCIKARKSDVRHVTVNGTTYGFAKRPDGEFVADVSNPADAETFLRSRHFRRADGKPVLKAPGADQDDEKQDGADAKGDPDAKDNDTEPADAVTIEAAQLIEGSAADIGRAVGQVSGLAVIRRAVELEEQGQKRKSVLTLLAKTLEAAKQAGVTD